MMKLVLYTRSDTHDEVTVGVLTPLQTVVALPGAVAHRASAQSLVESIIDRVAADQHDVARSVESGRSLPLTEVTLLPPVPRPGKILCCIGNYWEHAQRESRPLNLYFKNSDAVIGPGDIIRLPDHREPWIFMHEAELGVVIKGPAKGIKRADWRDAVFGYTCFIDVSAREAGRYTWKQGSFLGKSFDTFAPLGPCIVTADEIEDPNRLHVRLWNDGELRHDYSTDDMEHGVPELIEFTTAIMTLYSGDIIACGTNHEGLGAIQHGEHIEIEIEGVGRMGLDVQDPLGRVWDRGVYQGTDSTNHESVRRYRPQDEPSLLRKDS
jgi:2-keto-4-pentenoate hydratase/2-oxohepta-3-ene-1,7-dioic acid hydratase in catechol pathway